MINQSLYLLVNRERKIPTKSTDIVVVVLQTRKTTGFTSLRLTCREITQVI